MRRSGRDRRTEREVLKRRFRALMREFSVLEAREIRAQKRAGLTPYQWRLSAEAMALSLWVQLEHLGRQIGGIYNLAPADPDADVDARGRNRGVPS